MKRAILAIVGTVAGLVMLLSFKTHPDAAGSAAEAPSGPDTSDSPDATHGAGHAGKSPTATRHPSAAPHGSASPTKRATRRPAPVVRTVTGASIGTKYGPVQVRVTLKGGKIVRAQAIRSPNANSRDRQISAFSVPKLNREALAAQSARIDTVSGASYTSAGYRRSLQSALDKAGR